MKNEKVKNKGKSLPPMPKVLPRRLHDERYSYLESFREYAENNQEAVEWFLENAEEIRKQLNNK